VDVAGFHVGTDYSGSIEQSSDPINIGMADASFAGGAFFGSIEDITVTGSMYIHGVFLSTRGVMTVGGDFVYDEPDTTGVIEEQIIVDQITLTAADISNKYVGVSGQPKDESSVALNVLGGGPQMYGTDYYVSDYFVHWSGLGLDGYLGEGDVLRIVYETEPVYLGGFENNQGTVRLQPTGNRFEGNGIEFHTLEIRDTTDSTNTVQVDSSCFVNRSLYLHSGAFFNGTDGTIYVHGDATCSEWFGQAGSGSLVSITMDGTREQNLYSLGGVWPTLVIDRTASNQVMAWGHNPIRIDGDLSVVDGTFNTNGLSLEVGGTL
jgi:hypothetical protein